MPNIRMIFECESLAQLKEQLSQQIESLNGAMPERIVETQPVQPKPEAAAQPTASIAQPTAQIAQPAAPATVPTTAVAYTLDQLSEAVAPIARDEAKIPQLRSLLSKYGVQGMMELPVEAYGAFAADIRAMGARI